MIEFSELELVQRARDGDRDAFEAIVTANERQLWNLALRTLNNREDAADALQETFLKAWTGLASFRGDSKLSVWLYRILSNVCVDLLRRRKDTVSLTVEDEEGQDTELDLPDERSDPVRLTERKETREAVRSAVEHLPEEFRQPLLLREFSELSYDEISAALNIPVATVKTRIFRARKRLCAILDSDGNFLEAKTSKSKKGGVRA